MIDSFIVPINYLLFYFKFCLILFLFLLGILLNLIVVYFIGWVGALSNARGRYGMYQFHVQPKPSTNFILFKI